MTLAISPRNVVTVTGANPLHLRLALYPEAGIFLGELATGEAISGILDEKANLGAGLSVGQAQTGAVTIVPQ